MLSKSFFQKSARLIFFTFVFFILCAIETSVWPFTLTFFPSPPLWIILIVFIIIRLPLYTGIFFSYFLGLILTRYTYMPLKIVWNAINLIYIFIWSIKNRFIASGFSSFAGLCAFANVLFSIFQILLSQVLESNPMGIHFFEKIIETGLVFIFSIPLYYVLHFVDSRLVGQPTWEVSRYDAKDDL